MTTHDQEVHTQPTEGFENQTEPADPGVEQVSDPRADAATECSEPEPQAVPTQAQAPVPQPEAAVVSSEPSSAHSADKTDESTTGRALFADDERAGLSARWDNVQAGFVDDPRECVQKADGLVSDVVDQLTASFSDARARLEEQWARGEEASTEDLRVALKQYREFFQRLLAV